jgi:hypothetical protein
MGNSGCNLPPGCYRTPGEEDVYIHPLSEEFYTQLEDAGVENRDALVATLDAAIAAIHDALRGPFQHDELDAILAAPEGGLSDSSGVVS